MYALNPETYYMLTNWIRSVKPDADEADCVILMKKHFEGLNLEQATMKASLFLFDTAWEHGNKAVIDTFLPLALKHHWISLICERLKICEDKERLIRLLTTICEVKS